MVLVLVIGTFGCSDDQGPVDLAPADIIVVVDNSGDMTPVVQGIQNNFISGFSQQFEDADLDHRIILISKYGMVNDASLCIEMPLSGIGNCTNPPVSPVNSSRFYHYSAEISSNDALCQLLETLNAPDEFNLMPNGWIQMLRTDASKHIIVFSNDGADCFSGVAFDDLNTIQGGTAAATAFHTTLSNLAPVHFGTPSDPSYRFVSLSGVTYKDPGNPAAPYTATDPITIEECNIAVQPGTGYQGLSILTNGSRFSLCEPDDHDMIFRAIAQEVIDAASN